MRLTLVFLLVFQSLVTHAVAADAAPKGLERVIAAMFVTRCVDQQSQWADESVIRQTFRSRTSEQTQSISGLSDFSNDLIEEFNLDGRVFITALGKGGRERANIFGGIRLTDSRQYCYFNSAGSNRAAIVAELENQGARRRADPSGAEKDETFCFNHLRRNAVAHEVYVFTHAGVDGENLSPRGETLIRYDTGPGASSCLGGE